MLISKVLVFAQLPAHVIHRENYQHQKNILHYLYAR